MVNINNIRLTASEITNLWTTYMNDSINDCLMSHFLQHCIDTDVKPKIEQAIKIARKHKEQLSMIFNYENIPIPDAFSIDKDVNLDSPKLFADTLALVYLKDMSIFGISAYGQAVSTSARSDITDFFVQCLNDTTKLQVDVIQTLQQKGVYIRIPYMTKPDKVEYVKKGFLTGWFGDRRALTGLEITHLCVNYQHNALGKAILIGFSQVSQSKEVINYFLRGIELSNSIMALIEDKLTEGFVPHPLTWDNGVLNSTVNTFSEKLMMALITGIATSSIGNYGIALGFSARRDIAALYAKFIKDAGQFSEDGANILIKNEWMEKPPQSDDKLKLAKQKHQ
ncbi:DUF3231 family protein [Cytobacillus suaedae]|nr:DUF3231 family protein [Cytobacillus suaedae]